MGALFNAAGDLVLAALFGGMVFFPAVVAPLVFKVLDEAQAGRFLRALFPGYYAYIIALSLIAAPLSFGRPIAVVVLVAIAGSTVLVRQVLMPKLNAWRDAELAGDEQAGERFQSGHKLSVMINVAQMIALAGVIAVR